MKNVQGKIVRRLYLNQFVMAIFGFMVVGATGITENVLLIVLASILAIGLYLFLIYDIMWNAGAKDVAKRLRPEDAQVEKIKTPLITLLFASALNIICAILYAISWVSISANELTEGGIVLLSDIVRNIIGFTNTIYWGIDALLFPHPLTGIPYEEMVIIEELYGLPTIVELTPPYFYFLYPLPLILIGILAYYLGSSEMKLSSILRQLGIGSDE